MEKMVEVEPATQDELRQDLKSLFQGAIRLTLEMVLEEELKAINAPTRPAPSPTEPARSASSRGCSNHCGHATRSATIRAGRQPEGPQERDVSEAPAYEPGSDRRDGPAQPGRRLARRRDGSLPAQE